MTCCNINVGKLKEKIVKTKWTIFRAKQSAIFELIFLVLIFGLGMTMFDIISDLLITPTILQMKPSKEVANQSEVSFGLIESG